MLNHYDFQIKAMNTAIRMTLRSQCVQPESSFYGAVEWLDKGYTGAHSAVCVAREMIEGYYTPQCAYAGDELLLERARIALIMRCGSSMKTERLICWKPIFMTVQKRRLSCRILARPVC